MDSSELSSCRSVSSTAHSGAGRHQRDLNDDFRGDLDLFSSKNAWIFHVFGLRVHNVIVRSLSRNFGTIALGIAARPESMSWRPAQATGVRDLLTPGKRKTCAQLVIKSVLLVSQAFSAVFMLSVLSQRWIPSTHRHPEAFQ